MIVGAYTLTLYCVNHPVSSGERENPHKLGPGFEEGGFEEFNGHNKRECMNAARRAGWRFIIGKDGSQDARCPECKGKNGTPNH